MLNAMFARLRKENEKEAALFVNESDKISETNKEMLISCILLGGTTLFAMIVISLLVKNFYMVRAVYLTFFIPLPLLYVAVKQNSGKVIGRILFYSFYAWQILFANWLSIVISPEQRATIILALIVTLPILMIDRTYRINGCVILLSLMSILFAFAYKDTSCAINDMVNITVVSGLGIVIGRNVRKSKLKNFSSETQLLQQRNTDFLTGLHNRRMLYETLAICQDKECNRTIKGIIMLDIDWFKKLNDVYGHQYGDDCLALIGNHFLEYGEENNLDFFRYGGEEFLAISWSHTYNEIEAICKEIKEMVEMLDIPAEFSPYKKVTVSIGFAEVTDCPHTSYEKLISKADQALYQAKNQSRNTIMGCHSVG